MFQLGRSFIHIKVMKPLHKDGFTFFNTVGYHTFQHCHEEMIEDLKICVNSVQGNSVVDEQFVVVSS